MARTITITRGNQYAADGYHITDGTLASYGRADASKPGGYCLGRDGRLHPYCRLCPRCHTYCDGDCEAQHG